MTDATALIAEAQPPMSPKERAQFDPWWDGLSDAERLNEALFYKSRIKALHTSLQRALEQKEAAETAAADELREREACHENWDRFRQGLTGLFPEAPRWPLFQTADRIVDRIEAEEWARDLADSQRQLNLERAEAAEAERDRLRELATQMVAWKEPIQLIAPELGGILRTIYALEHVLQPNAAAPDEATGDGSCPPQHNIGRPKCPKCPRLTRQAQEDCAAKYSDCPFAQPEQESGKRYELRWGGGRLGHQLYENGCTMPVQIGDGHTANTLLRGLQSLSENDRLKAKYARSPFQGRVRVRNKYPGTCYRCGKRVAAGDGHFERFRNSWRVQHAECAIEYRGVPDPEREAHTFHRLMLAARGTGRKAQRARRRLRDRAALEQESG